VFVPFEDRKRDLTDLLGFGTVVQIFGSEVPWQLTTERVPAYLAAVRRYFRAHDVTDRDFIVAIGDPVVITLTALAAAEANAGRVTMLRWARLPCRYCDRYTPIKPCPNHERRGVYHPITLDALDDHSE
jgi:hypothetical protein